MSLDEIRQYFSEYGAKPCHVARLFRLWLAGGHFDDELHDSKLSQFYPLLLQKKLPELASKMRGMAYLDSDHIGSDQAVRLLVRLADTQSIESVLLPRDGLCVSSQVGCAVGCKFCMTGQGGLFRQLSDVEIVLQLVLARRLRRVKKIVFMGMGEPAHNLPNVMRAIDLFGKEGGIGHKSLVLSTVGDLRVFTQLDKLVSGDVKPALAVSLHTLNPEKRAELLPHAPRIDPVDLISLADEYARKSAYPIQLQWTLLEGINDGEDEIRELAECLKGRYAMLNFIAYNPTDNDTFRRPSVESMQRKVEILRKQGVIACLRDSAGQDVEGACGQLRARVLKRA